MRNIRIPLLGKIVIAIALGVACGNFFAEPLVRVFATFNAIFSQFLGFMIPLIIVGLVTPAIADIGRGAGRLVGITVGAAYADTIIAGLLAYGVGSWLFPAMVEGVGHVGQLAKAEEIAPYFTLAIPPMLDVMTALVLSFLLGLAIAAAGLASLKAVADDFKQVIGLAISRVIIPLLPLYIFGIFLGMTFSGEAYRILLVFAKIIVVIFVLHVLILVYLFCAAGAVSRRNPLRLLLTMLPAYMTALGTSSSAATIPVTLRQTLKNGVSEGVAGFVVPLCATIHMPGSCMKITACALTVCMLHGMPHDPALFLYFILMLGIMMVAGPGVPGGAVMAALAPLGSILGFNSDEQALIIALYIAMDSFGTACNVTGDGALALMIDAVPKKHAAATAE